MLEEEQLPLRLDRYLKIRVHLRRQSKRDQQIHCKHQAPEHIQCYKVHFIDTFKRYSQICEKHR